MRIIESISISREPQVIWDFWLPVVNEPRWRSGAIETRWTSEPPYGVGSTGLHLHRKFGEVPWEVTGWEEGRLIEFVHRGGKLVGSVGTYRVEPEQGGCRVTIEGELVLPFLMRILWVFLGGRMRRGIREDLERLKAIMEGEPPS